jgi:hypothetical protein
MDLQGRFQSQSVLLYLKRYRIHLLRFLMGASFAVSLFLFEAGASDLLLARDDSCRAMVRQRRLLGDPERECLPRLARDVLTALNEGFFILVEQNANRISHWGIMAGIYALVGGMAAQIKGRGGIVAFAIVHLLFLAIQTFLAYVSVYIVGIK